MDEDILNSDLYKIIGVELNATPKEISKQFRLKALKLHPDKNPDNPQAHEQFQKLSKAYEILSDDKAKAAYDNIRAAKQQKMARESALDERRRKLKEDVERREKEALEAKWAAKNGVHRHTQEGDGNKRSRLDEEDYLREQFRKEVERLRTEGARLLHEQQLKRELEEQELIQRKQKPLQQQQTVSTPIETLAAQTHPVKCRWQPTPDAGYTKAQLEERLSKYGALECIVMSSKPGSALAVFLSRASAETAVKQERGRSGCALKLSEVAKPSGEHNSPQPTEQTSNLQANPVTNCKEAKVDDTLPSFPVPDPPPKVIFPSFTFSARSNPSPSSSNDFESATLMRLRQAQEKKRLASQLQSEMRD